MRQLTHDSARDALADGDTEGAVQEHLRSCPECRRFADALTRVDEIVATMEPPAPPAGLADRVVTGLTDRGAAGETAHRRSVRRAWQRSLVAVAAAAAVLIGVLFVHEPSGEPPKAVLIAAAEHLEEDRTAVVRVDGTVDVTVRRAGSDPDFSGLPPELEGYFEARWNEMMTEFERSMAEFEQQVGDVLGEIDDIFDDFGTPGAPAPPTAPPDPPQGPSDQAEPTPPPDDLTLRLELQATGVVDVDGRLELDGKVRPVAGTLPVPDTEVAFGVSVGELGPVIRLPDGSRATLPSPDAGLAAVLAQPGALPALLRAAEGDVVAAGRTEVAGEEVMRYRFRAHGRDIEARIGADGRLRTLAVGDQSTEGSSQWRSRLDVTVTDVGVESPEGDGASPTGVSVSAPSGAGVMLHPLGPAVAEALRSGR